MLALTDPVTFPLPPFSNRRANLRLLVIAIERDPDYKALAKERISKLTCFFLKKLKKALAEVCD